MKSLYKKHEECRRTLTADRVWVAWTQTEELHPPTSAGREVPVKHERRQSFTARGRKRNRSVQERRRESIICKHGKRGATHGGEQPLALTLGSIGMKAWRKKKDQWPIGKSEKEDGSRNDKADGSSAGACPSKPKLEIQGHGQWAASSRENGMGARRKGEEQGSSAKAGRKGLLR